MGVLSTILGNGDVITKGLNLIDDLHTSEEEMVQVKTERQVNLLNSYAPFKVAQRLLAGSISYVWLLLPYLVCIHVHHLDASHFRRYFGERCEHPLR